MAIPVIRSDRKHFSWGMQGYVDNQSRTKIGRPDCTATVSVHSGQANGFPTGSITVVSGNLLEMATVEKVSIS
ncbi:hypothetical protein KKG41_00225 [Patescibacteria group bacterium]|nr:hypothetical protein [Patescibacteria group bacterium]MBU1890650.1 hypothetical protein [Patescibacteria group bacterium]